MYFYIIKGLRQDEEPELCLEQRRVITIKKIKKLFTDVNIEWNKLSVEISLLPDKNR